MPINGYENYSVSSMGRVWSVKNGVLKTPINNFGYPHFNLCKDGFSQRNLVHRLMAKAFLNNPENKREVNHINGVRHDNRLENLEWVTSSENKIHRYEILNGRGAENNHRRKTIIAYREGMSIVLEFFGIREAERFLELKRRAIQSILGNKKRTTKGWRFELLDDPKWVSKTGKKY